MNFDDWFNTGKNWQYDKDACEDAFEAGQKSRQEDVDDLKEKLQSILNRVCMLQQSNGERIYKEIKEMLNELWWMV